MDGGEGLGVGEDERGRTSLSISSETEPRLLYSAILDIFMCDSSDLEYNNNKHYKIVTTGCK